MAPSKVPDGAAGAGAAGAGAAGVVAAAAGSVAAADALADGLALGEGDADVPVDESVEGACVPAAPIVVVSVLS